MPFKSIAQEKFMYANHPDIAKRWSAETQKPANLPERVAPQEQAPSSARKFAAMKNLIKKEGA